MTDQPTTQDDAATVNIDLLVRHRIPHMHPPDVVGWCRCWLHDERCAVCDEADRAEASLSHAAPDAYDAVMAEVEAVRAEHPNHD